jgi:hypothetical protein
MRTHFTKLLLGLIVVGGWAGVARAQSFGSGEWERALRPGAYVPHDGAPFSHRYQYGAPTVLYFNGDARRLWYLDYLDRADRADRFGYRPPPEPVFGPPCPSRVRFGVSAGFFFAR